LLGATGLIRLRGPVGARAGGGIVHGDLARGLLFDSGSEPALTEVVPYARPASWSAAVVAVDALSRGTADRRSRGRWAHRADWPQRVLRAAVFRLAGHGLRPGSRPAAMDGLQPMARAVDEYVGDTGAPPPR